MLDVSDLNVNEATTIGETNMTPLMIATVFGHKELVQAILSKGVDVNAVNSHLETAAHLAYQEGYWDILELLAKNGTDLVKVSFPGTSVHEELCKTVLHPDTDKTCQQKLKIAAQYASLGMYPSVKKRINKERREHHFKIRRIEGYTPEGMKRYAKYTNVARFIQAIKNGRQLKGLTFDMQTIISECYSFFKNNEKKVNKEKQKSMLTKTKQVSISLTNQVER